MKHRFIAGLSGFFCCTIVFLISCSENKTAVIWTDRPEFALYGEYFNAAQNQHKVMVRYFEFPAEELKKSSDSPDIIVGSWLKNASTGTLFRSLNNLFGTKKLSRSIFYQRLLAVGRKDRSQHLLPISFNVPALIFTRETGKALSNPFTISFDEVKSLSSPYNALNRGAYTRMGFSPLWSNDFLFMTAILNNTSFKEASPLAWNEEPLNSSMDFIYTWTHEINTDNQAAEDFTFKYLIEPPEMLVKSGRILFSYMESNTLFLLSDDRKNNLDFRWIMENNSIPMIESSVYLGIPKKGKNQKAARAFIQWFFNVDNQRQLMEYTKANRINETVFGICGGFSAIEPVTGQIFTRFYPDLLGRMPPSEFLTPSSDLPANWKEIKERVILPYLNDRARSNKSSEVYPLENRLSDWIRMNL